MPEEPSDPSTPPSEPSNPSPPVSDGPIDLNKVRWLGPDISTWAVTSKLTRVALEGNHIILEHTKAPDWPGKDVFNENKLLAGNAWIFIKKDGYWYAATWEWLRPGQTRKLKSAVAGDHIKKNPFKNWSPIYGIDYYFMTSGLARTAVRNVEERSDPVKLTWK